MPSRDELLAEFDRLYMREGELMSALRNGEVENMDIAMRGLTIVGDKLELMREQLSAMAAEADKKIVEVDADK